MDVIHGHRPRPSVSLLIVLYYNSIPKNKELMLFNFSFCLIINYIS